MPKKRISIFSEIYPFLTGKIPVSPTFKKYLDRCYPKVSGNFLFPFECVDDTFEAFYHYNDINLLLENDKLSQQWVQFLQFPLSRNEKVHLFPLAFPLVKIKYFQESVQLVLNIVSDEALKQKIRDYQQKVLLLPKHFIQLQHFEAFDNLTRQMVHDDIHAENLIRDYFDGDFKILFKDIGIV